MSKITESQVTKFTTSDGREFLDKIEAEYAQSIIEVKALFKQNDFEYSTRYSELDGGDMAMLIGVSKILTKYNQV